MKKIVFVLFALCSCASNSDLEQMKKYQQVSDMDQMRYTQQDRDEKLRKEMKREHKDDILFNLAVTKEQVSIDNHKFDMINRYHIDGAEHLTWDNVDRYNQILNKDRARLENEDGISRSDDVPNDQNDSDQTKQDTQDTPDISNTREKDGENLTPQHFTVPADTPKKDSNRDIIGESL